MDDLEATRLCAEAMAITHSWTQTNVYFGTGAWDLETSVSYQPLHDDAQAMALVRTFELSIAWSWAHQVSVMPPPTDEKPIEHLCTHTDLRRAIVYCVAAMQSASDSARVGARREE